MGVVTSARIRNLSMASKRVSQDVSDGMEAISFEHDQTKNLVSVVIPTYQGERFIGEALASVGSQSYAPWEVVVVDDGPSGPTQRIVEDFARRHPSHRVSYSRNDRNFGAAHTRNVAFAKARGEFVALLDADDRWLPDHLTVSAEALQDSSLDIVYSTALMIEDQTNLVLGTWGPYADELADFPQSLLGRSYVTPSATVLRRQVLHDVGPWNAGLRYCEDFDFWMRCVAAGKQFRYVGGCRCLYRKNHEGATTQRLCGTMEEVAEVTERYMHATGRMASEGPRYAAKAYARAGRLHAKADPLRDPSADPSRSPRLMIKAWRLRPAHVSYLFRAARYGFRQTFRGRSRFDPAPPAASNPPARTAA